MAGTGGRLTRMQGMAREGPLRGVLPKVGPVCGTLRDMSWDPWHWGSCRPRWRRGRRGGQRRPLQSPPPPLSLPWPPVFRGGRHGQPPPPLTTRRRRPPPPPPPCRAPAGTAARAASRATAAATGRRRRTATRGCRGDGQQQRAAADERAEAVTPVQSAAELPEPPDGLLCMVLGRPTAGRRSSMAPATAIAPAVLLSGGALLTLASVPCGVPPARRWCR